MSTCTVLVLSGCVNVPVLVAPSGVKPLQREWSTTKIDERQVRQLCRLEARRFPLRWFWRPRLTDCRTTDGMTKDARNELQHELLGAATQACHRYKNKLYSMTKGGMLFGALSQVSSAASGLLRVERSANIAASAGTVAGGLGGDFDGYFQDSRLEVALSGIELARTRIFKQLRKNRNKPVPDYPVSQAVNDAFRYNNVCAFSEGLRESNEAVQSVISEEQGR